MSSPSTTSILVKSTVNFLGRICNPAADEIGLLLEDKVKAYRSNNFTKIVKKAEEKVNKKERIEPKINPRILHSIYEHGSWSETDDLQNMWAGILTSSCFDNASDKNMLYVDILSKITTTEAKIFSYIAENIKWTINDSTTLPESNAFFPQVAEVNKRCGIKDLEQLDESMTHLAALGVIRFEEYPNIEHYNSTNNNSNEEFDETSQPSPDWGYAVELSLTQIGYRLFLKTQGESLSIKEFIQREYSSESEQEFDLY